MEGLVIREHKFLIQTPLGVYERRTDFNGCLTWSEAIHFNYLSPEKFYHYEVQIEGTGDYRGRVSLDLAINPWPESTDQILKDLRYVDNIHLDAPLTEQEFNRSFEYLENSFPPFLLSDVQFEQREITRDDLGQKIDFSYSMRPFFQRTQRNGTRQRTPISKGLIELRLKLYEKLEGRDQLIELDQQVTEIDFDENQVTGNISFHISHQNIISPTSSLILALVAKPLKTNQQIPPEQGMVFFQSLTNSSSVGLERKRDIQEYLTLNYQFLNEKSQQGTPIQSISDERIQDIIETFRIDSFTQSRNIDLVSVRIDKSLHLGEYYNQRAQRSVEAIFHACLTNRSSTQHIYSETVIRPSFQSYKNPSEKIALNTKTANHNGCFQVEIPIEYNIYSGQKWIPKLITIEVLSGRMQGEKIQRLIAINPWAEGHLFARDLHHVTLPEIQEDIPPKIAINQIKYAYEGNHYNKLKLNEFLELGLSKTYQIQMSPLLEYANTFQRELPPAALTFGNFKLQLEVYIPKTQQVSYTDIDFNEWILFTATSKDVSVNSSGTINTEVHIPLLASQANLLTYKNLLVFTLIPLDEDASNLRSAHYATPFFGLYPQADLYTTKLTTRNLGQKEAHASEINDILNRGLDFFMTDNEEELSNIDLFREYLTTNAINENKVLTKSLEDFNQSQDINNQLSDDQFRFLSGGSTPVPNQILRKFCHTLYPVDEIRPGLVAFLFHYTERKEQQKQQQECYNSPREYLTLIPLKHIKRIIPYRIRDEQGEIISTVTARMSSAPHRGTFHRGNGAFSTTGDRYAETTGSRDSYGYTGGADFSPRVPFFGARAGYGYELFTYRSDEKGRFDWLADRISTQRNIDLDYESIALDFSAEVHPCVAVEAQHSNYKIHVCQDNTILKNLTEFWYFIGRHDSRDHGVIADSNPMVENNEISFIIRGQANYKSLWAQMTDEDNMIIINKLRGEKLSDQLERIRQRGVRELLFEGQGDNSFPGLFIPDDNDTNLRDYHQ